MFFCFRSSEVFRLTSVNSSSNSWGKLACKTLCWHHLRALWSMRDRSDMGAPSHFFLWQDPKQPVPDTKPKETQKGCWEVRWGAEELNQRLQSPQISFMVQLVHSLFWNLPDFSSFALAQVTFLTLPPTIHWWEFYVFFSFRVSLGFSANPAFFKEALPVLCFFGKFWRAFQTGFADSDSFLPKKGDVISSFFGLYLLICIIIAEYSTYLYCVGTCSPFPAANRET